MEHLYSYGGEDSQHCDTLPSVPNSDAELEGDTCSGFISEISALKIEFEKMCNKLPLLLDVKQENDSQRCHVSSCPGGNKLGINYIGFVSPHKDFPEHCVGFGNRASDPLSIFYRGASLFSIPLKRRSSGFSFESQKNHRSTRSVDNAGDFLVNCSPTTGVSPSGRWIFESKEGTMKTRTLLDSSLIFQLGVLDSKMRQPKSTSPGTQLIKSSELGSQPFVLRKTIGSQSSKQNILERKLVSCPSTNSTYSCVPASSAKSFSQGLLCCVWTSGIPHFVFSLDNDGGDIYMANLRKVNSSVDKALDYVYMFHSKNYRGHHKSASDTVGKMKVSSSVVLDSNKSKLMETEFVLCGCREDYLREMESSHSTPTRNKGLWKKATEIFRSNHLFKHRSILNFGPNFQLDDFMQEMFAGELEDSDELDSVDHCVQDFPPNLELAAIIVKDHRWNSKKAVVTGGWGLKFLEKVQLNDTDDTEESSFSCADLETSRKMKVLVPAGFHGGPINTTGGPSSLTERWKAGGHCDCGGWDLGCPLTVFDNNSMCSASSIQDETKEDPQSVRLFLKDMIFQGTDHGEPALTMVSKSNGLYLINFQPSLSAIQSFAIAVATIHSQSPDLHPKL